MLFRGVNQHRAGCKVVLTQKSGMKMIKPFIVRLLFYILLLTPSN